VLDATDWRILHALQEDARLTLSDLGRQVKLSQPAVAERVRRLERTGMLRGYHAEVDPAQFGLPIMAFMRLKLRYTDDDRFIAVVHDVDAVVECHRVTGDDCFLLKVRAASIPHLETIINQFAPYGDVATSIVLSSAVTRRTLQQRDLA
jgi:Lrp/AsnC family leucine-responsive transcriptional regulator